tara:strand:- start:9903 stop:10808 length:906 start_codon:yes stop_codon:yes gene_type:complete
VIYVTAIRIEFITREVLRINWEIRDHFETIGNYRFTVLRSNSPEGPYVAVSPALTDTYVFDDISVDMHSLHREWYYQIQVVNAVTAETVVYGANDPDETYLNGARPGGVAPQAPPDKIVTESRYRLNLVLKEFSGRRVLWFPKRTFGQLCTNCVDELTQKRMQSRCLECYGSSFSGGYFNPVEIYAQMGPSIDKDILHWIGQIEPRQSVILINGVYRPKPGDLLCEVEGRRWIIDRVQPTEKLRSRVRNTMVAHELTKGEVEFDIRVNWSRDSLTASPLRQFLPVTDVESYRSALSDINQV